MKTLTMTEQERLIQANLEALTDDENTKNSNYVMDRVTATVAITASDGSISYYKTKISCCVSEEGASCPWEEQNDNC